MLGWYFLLLILIHDRFELFGDGFHQFYVVFVGRLRADVQSKQNAFSFFSTFFEFFEKN